MMYNKFSNWSPIDYFNIAAVNILTLASLEYMHISLGIDP